MRKHKREYLVEVSGLSPNIRCEALDARDAGKFALAENPDVNIRLTIGETYGGWPDREVSTRWNIGVFDAASTDIYRSIVGRTVLSAKRFSVAKGRVDWI